MAIQEFLSTRQVFTAEEFAAHFPGSQTDRNLLTRAVRRGAVDKVRRGVYVSKTGRFEGVPADPFAVALAVAPDAVFCYTSALQLLGLGHNLTNQIQFFITRRTAAFTYAGTHYRPRRATSALSPQNVLTPAGRSYRVTTKEQTLIDCLINVAAAGGPDNLLHSLSGLARLNADLAAEIAVGTPYSVHARLGWTLEVKRDDWRVPDQTLTGIAESLGAGPYYFWSASAPKDRFWVKRWKLYLPYPEQEMASWLTA
jgi:predicted transcriptional regulator of viral defense system